MAVKVKAKVKFSSFDYVGTYSEPAFEPIRMFAAINPLYRALKAWNVSPQDVKYGAGLSTSEPLISIQLAKTHYTVNVGLASFGFKATFVAWDQAPIIIEIINSASTALAGALNMTLVEHNLTIVMQLAIEGKSIGDLTRHLSMPLGYPAADTDFYGFLLYSKDGSLYTVDKSAADPDDLFVRIVRKYGVGHSMDEMAKGMYESEQGLAQALGIEIE